MALYPDLAFARRQVGKLMEGTACRVSTWPVETFDETTGVWSTAPGTVLYTGACLFRAGGADQQASRSSGEGEQIRAGWSVKLGAAAPVFTLAQIEAGLVVEFTAVARDPGLVGHRLKVDRQMGSALPVTRRLLCSDYQPTIRRLP